MARPQISPLAGGVTREIASSPPSSSPPSGDTVQKCTPTAHELRETSGSHAIRESSLREGKDRSRHTLSLSLFAKEISTPPRARFGVFRGIVGRYLMSIPIIICDCVSVIHMFLEEVSVSWLVGWQFRREGRL